MMKGGRTIVVEAILAVGTNSKIEINILQVFFYICFPEIFALQRHSEEGNVDNGFGGDG